MNNEKTNRGLARQLVGGVIMDVVTADDARVAEDAGACAVMALERVPSDIRKDGGVARMSAPELIEGIREAVSIPVMAKCRIGHMGEARILEALGVDFIDESEVLTPAVEAHHLDKHALSIPVVCGARNLGEALRRIGEGASLIRTKGEAGTGDVVEAVRHLRLIRSEMNEVLTADDSELSTLAKDLGVPLAPLIETRREGRLPTPNFAAGGIATPADASMMMMLGAESVFVGSGIFKSSDPPAHARAIVGAVQHWNDPQKVLEYSRGLGAAMAGIESHLLPHHQRLQMRGE